ncbi:hypothetical protein RSSM_05157 [Rhodopirellula sallentina SM41]|uniref:Uncharacterized protein n=1 Tax=Rhodopirellula sallentina SM41 TaxID=1263870 RepID=M5TW58_9BACT|nr:hypothetical protein RSSM_05157 [Rhodopirellula sallentina SM41]
MFDGHRSFMQNATNADRMMRFWTGSWCLNRECREEYHEWATSVGKVSHAWSAAEKENSNFRIFCCNIFCSATTAL